MILLLKKILLFLGSVIVLLMICSTLFLNIANTNVLIIIFLILINIFIIFFSIKLNRYSNKAFFIMLIFVSSIIYFTWNIYAMTQPVSDYKVLLDGAKEIVEGNFNLESFNKSSYFYFYNYQIGYTMYLALLVKIFGSSLIYFKIIEATSIILTSIIIYKICKTISNTDAAAAASILYATYIPNIMGSSVINNQHISTLFLCLSLYFIIKGTTKSLAIGGILLGFTNILRPIALIILIGFSIVYICKIIKEKRYFMLSKKYVIFIIGFILVVKGFDIAIIKSGISPSPISKSNASYFKFVLGLKGRGLYNIPGENARKTQVFFDLKTLDFDYNRYNEQCFIEIKNLMKNYKSTVPFIKNKMYHFMGYSDNQYSFALKSKQINNYIHTLIKMGNMQYVFFLMCVFISIILKFNNSKDDIDIFLILIIGFVLIHILIETQSRYRYEIYVFIDILASQFIVTLYSRCLSLYKNSTEINV